MIINTGQRSDIPAFYSKWFMNRIKEGYVDVRNPYYPGKVKRFMLNPDVVDVIGFCTKNPKPMFKYLDELKNYGQFWYVTITGFKKDMEPNVPSVDESISNFRYLSEKVGSNSVGWRYTPIIINDIYTVDYHIETFEKIAKELKGYTSLSVFGFLDVYPKLLKNHPEIKDTSEANKIYIAKAFKEIAKKYGYDLRLCSKEKWLKDYGIDANGCMRLEDYEKAIGKSLKPKKKMAARSGFCNCFLSNDIGAYNSCLHLCKYCYANGKEETVRKNYALHDDNSSFLIGEANPADKLFNAVQESWTIKEISLF